MKYAFKILLTLLIFNGQWSISNAQVAINEDNSAPDASAMLDISSADKGVLIPRMDSNSRQNIPSPANGLMVFDTDTNSFWYYSTNWIEIKTTGLIQDTDGDTKIQVEESSDDDIIRFDMNGTEYLRFDNGRIEPVNTGESVFLGEGAGENDTYTDNKNVFIGYQSGNSNTIGSQNIFQGYQSGYSNNFGAFNVFQGYQSGYSNTSGNNNTFQGYQSGYSNTLGSANVFLGNRSGYANSTGAFNTFLGMNAGGLNTTGGNNIFVGSASGSSNITGNANIYLGIRSGSLNQTGNNNINIGYEAGRQNMGGENNIFLGYQAGYNETASNKLYIENSDSSTPLIYGEFDNDLLAVNGQLNVSNDFLVGASTLDWGSGTETKLFFDEDKGAFRAGAASTSSWDESNLGLYSFAFGRYTTASGDYSAAWGASSATEDYATSWGYDTRASGFTATAWGDDSRATGNTTTAWGYGSIAEAYNSTAWGSNNETKGSHSTAWGVHNEATSYAETVLGSYTTTYMPNSASSFDSADRLFVIGNGTADNSRSDAMIVYKSGNTAINGELTINNAFTLPSADGTANQVLSTDGAGTLSWSDIDKTLLADNDGDTKIQVEEGSDDDIIRFDMNGQEYFRLDKGRIETINTSNSVFLGENAGENDDYSDNECVFIGNNSGYSNTSGNANVFIGNNSGYANTSGTRNIFMGKNSGTSNTTGYENVFLGSHSGLDNTTGYQNTFSGYRSGYENTTGNRNVFLGYESGYTNTTGTKNVFLGHRAGYNETGSDKLYIDNSNTTTPLIYGDFSTDDVEINGYLGINATPTNARLEIDGTNGLYSFTNAYALADQGAGLYTGSHRLSIYANDGIVATEFIVHSDERIKNVQGISNSEVDLARLQQIEITDYTFIDTIQKGNQAYKKVIAQQVAEVFPQAVTTGLTQVIPNIYQLASIDENGWVTGCELSVASCLLKKGDKVQIIFDEEKELLEVLEVNGNTFQVEFKVENGQHATHNSQLTSVFVYGKQVTDFHNVDYDAIAMLNVSATQQLAKENQLLKSQLEDQQAELKQLKTSLQEVEKLKQLSRNLAEQNTEMKVLLEQIQAQLNNN